MQLGDKELDDKIYNELKSNGVKFIHYFNIYSETLIFINTDKGGFQYYNGTLYKHVEPESKLWENCSNGEISEVKFKD